MNVTEPRVGGKTLIIVPELCNPSTDEYHKWYRFPHNPLYVASYLRATGVDVDMLNLNHCGNQELQKVLTSQHYDYVYTGGNDSDGYAIHRLIPDLRSISGDSIIIVGGLLGFTHPEYVCNTFQPDYLVTGESEVTVLRLISQLSKDEPIGEVPGLAFLDGDGFCTTGVAPRIRDLDSIPFPDYEGFGYDDYIDKFSYEWAYQGMVDVSDESVRCGFVQGSRGCFATCTFCRVGQMKYSFRSIDNLMLETKHLMSKFNVNRIEFVDQVFAAKKERVYELCEKIAPLGISWTIQLRVNLVDQELLSTMKASGCNHIVYGYESMDDDLLGIMQKGVTSAEIEYAVRATKDAEITAHGNFIFGHPGETEQSIDKTLSFYRENRSYCFGLAMTLPLPGSTIFESLVKQSGDGDHLMRYFGHPSNEDFVNFSEVSDRKLEWVKFIMGMEPAVNRVRKYDFVKPFDRGYIVDLDCPVCSQKIVRQKIYLNRAEMYAPIGIDIVRCVCPHCLQKFYHDMYRVKHNGAWLGIILNDVWLSIMYVIARFVMPLPIPKPIRNMGRNIFGLIARAFSSVSRPLIS